MSVSDEAFMLLVLENQYDMWREAETTRVGWGGYTENGPNKKFCGWINDGMRRYNQLLAEVRDNRNKQYCKEVEDSTFKTLAERYKKMLGVRRKNSRKRRHHVSPEGTDDEEQEDDDDSIVPEDELVLLAMEPV
jgi:predicted aminopeptidase